MITYIIESYGLYKIGKTKNWGKRRMAYNTHNPTWKLIHIIHKDIEAELHLKYETKRITGEWFRLSKEDIDFLLAIENPIINFDAYPFLMLYDECCSLFSEELITKYYELGKLCIMEGWKNGKETKWVVLKPMPDLNKK